MDAPAPTSTAVGKAEYTQKSAALSAAWSTLTETPPIVTLPDRATPMFGSTVIVTSPPPATVAGEAESQSNVSLTVQVQSLRLSFTATVAVCFVVPDPLPTLTVEGETPVGDDGQGRASGSAACETVNVVPATAIVPERAAPAFFVAV